MSNNRQTLSIIFGVLFVLFVVSTALGQQSDSALSESQFMQIIDRIDKSEEKLRDHIDKKFGELDKRIDDIEEKFHELDKKVAVLRSDVDKLFTIIIAIALAVGAHLLIFIGAHIYSYWRNKTNVTPENRQPQNVSGEKALSIGTPQPDSYLPQG